MPLLEQWEKRWQKSVRMSFNWFGILSSCIKKVSGNSAQYDTSIDKLFHGVSIQQY
jgi:hypothetical protein